MTKKVVRARISFLYGKGESGTVVVEKLLDISQFPFFMATNMDKFYVSPTKR